MITFVLIGCGKIGKRHAEQMVQHGKLLAVCDIVQESADELALQYGVKAFYKIEDVIANNITVDVAAVCTPNGLHAEHTLLLLNAKYHVLCEKPMALTVLDCNKMIEAADRNGKKLFCVKQNRFNPPVAAVKKAIDEGKLGKIYSVQLNCFWNRNEEYYKNSWRGTRDLDGGTLFTQFSHFIDLLYWMIGDIKDAKAILKNFAHQNIIEFEDTGVVIVEFSDGAIGTINYTVNSFDKNMEGSLTFFAEKGTVKIGGEYLNELTYQNIQDYTIENLPTGNVSNNYGTYQGSMSNHDKIYENIINVLLHDESISVNAFEGLKTVEIINKIYASIATES